MPIIKSGLLLRISQLIGGPPVGGPTVLDDDSVSLTMPVLPEIARRSLIQGPLTGWYTSVMENVHSAADGELSSINPYEPGAAAVAPYPESVPDDFDVWLLKAFAQRSSGSGALTMGYLDMNPVTHQQGWGIDDAGAPVIDEPPVVLARWDSVEAVVTVAGATEPAMTEAGDTMVDVNIRIARGALLRFSTESAAAAEFQCLLLMGLFPSGLGQDVVT